MSSSKAAQYPSLSTIGLCVAAGLYLLALGLPALHMQSVNGLSDAHYSGLDCLAFGWSSLGTNIAWIANVLLVLSAYLLRRAYVVWALVSATAGVALSFTTLNFLGQTHAFFDPSHHNIQVGSIDVAFYFWVAAQLVVMVMAGIQIDLRLRGDAPRLAGRSAGMKDAGATEPVTQRSTIA